MLEPLGESWQRMSERDPSSSESRRRRRAASERRLVGGGDAVGRFLVLEDNEHQQRALSWALEERRPVDLAASIAEARGRLAEGGCYIGYVFDVQLPDGDGLGLLTERRGAADLTPAVVVTAQPIDRELALRVSPVGRLLPKPGTELTAPRFLEGLAQFVEEALDYEAGLLGPRAAIFDLSDGELTDAQMDVAVLGAQGYTRAEIARELGITVHTARSHIREVLFKTGLKGQGLSALARVVNRRRGGR